jgi:hypothetical protein
MMGIRQYLRPDIAASAIAHLSILALVFVYAEAHPFSGVPTQSVNVDIVTPDEIEKKAEPAPSPSPQLPPDLRALTKPAETPAPPPPAAQAAKEPPRSAARPGRKEAAVVPKPEPSPAQPQPQTQAASPPSPAPVPRAPTTAPSPPVGYVPPEPDVTVKYNVMLGLPEALPPSVLSADAGDRQGDGGDAAAKADVGADMVTAFRSRIRECSKLPPSLSPSEELMIKLRILMTRDGRLAAEPMVKEGTASLKAVDLKDSAVAALSACQPYTMLPPEKYNEWKVIDLTFTPRDFNS